MVWLLAVYGLINLTALLHQKQSDYSTPTVCQGKVFHYHPHQQFDPMTILEILSLSRQVIYKIRLDSCEEEQSATLYVWTQPSEKPEYGLRVHDINEFRKVAPDNAPEKEPAPFILPNTLAFRIKHNL